MFFVQIEKVTVFWQVAAKHNIGHLTTYLIFIVEKVCYCQIGTCTWQPEIFAKVEEIKMLKSLKIFLKGGMLLRSSHQYVNSN